MKTVFENAFQTRARFLELIERHSLATVNDIPNGFNNNLLWNFGHVLATEQLLLYKLSGKEMQMPEALIEQYRKGSKPTGKAPIGEWKQLMDFGRASKEMIKTDFEAGAFTSFEYYKTSAGIELHSAKEVLSFLPIHEGMHLGYAMALKRMLG